MTKICPRSRVLGIIFDKMDLGDPDKIEESVRKGLTDEKVKERARLGKEILENMPFTPKEKLLRHVQLAVKFGSNLSSWTPTGRHFNLVQYYNLDILGLVLTIFTALLYIIWKILSCLYLSRTTKSKLE